ncbi:MAG: hypothetical protein WCM76_15025 [Bacteroidota bacterium]
MNLLGKCIYCNELIGEKELTKHLSGHLEEQVQTRPSMRASAFYIKIKSGDYFLHLLVKDNCTLRQLDHFLRNIWLDCCGHESCFKDIHGSFAMKWELGQCMIQGMNWLYQYDSINPTKLFVSVIGRICLAMKKNIIILSRNEPINFLCDSCKTKPAVNIFSIHDLFDDEGRYCAECSDHHTQDCPGYKDFLTLPIVNSPRVGVCRYEGGCIDKERDQVLHAPKILN